MSNDFFEGLLLIEVDLFTSDEKYVCSVTLPHFKMIPNILIWGNRYFYNKDGRYLEGFGTVAGSYRIKTQEELENKNDTGRV